MIFSHFCLLLNTFYFYSSQIVTRAPGFIHCNTSISPKPGVQFFGSQFPYWKSPYYSLLPPFTAPHFLLSVSSSGSLPAPMPEPCVEGQVYSTFVLHHPAAPSLQCNSCLSTLLWCCGHRDCDGSQATGPLMPFPGLQKPRATHSWGIRGYCLSILIRILPGAPLCQGGMHLNAHTQ